MDTSVKPQSLKRKPPQSDDHRAERVLLEALQGLDSLVHSQAPNLRKLAPNLEAGFPSELSLIKIFRSNTGCFDDQSCLACMSG